MKTFLALLLFVPALAFGNTCPMLKGTYLCPGSNGTPDFTLIISQEMSEDRSSVEYLYDYPELGIPPIKVFASTKGELNTGDTPYWAHCFRNAMIYTNQNNSTGFFQSTALDRKRNLEVFVRGKRVIVCKRNYGKTVTK